MFVATPSTERELKSNALGSSVLSSDGGQQPAIVPSPPKCVLEPSMELSPARPWGLFELATLSMMGGVVVGSQQAVSGPCWLLLISLGLCLVALGFAKRHWIGVALPAAAFIWGLWLVASVGEPALPSNTTELQTAIFRVSSAPVQVGSWQRAEIVVEQTSHGPYQRFVGRSLRLRIKVRPSQGELEIGGRYVARLEIMGAGVPLNPGAIDRRIGLRRHDLDGDAKAKGKLYLVDREQGPIWEFRRRLAHFRQGASAALGYHSDRGILAALALGEGRGVSPAVRKRFTRFGLAHVLAVSGLHFGLVALALTRFLVWFFCRLGVGGAFGAQRLAGLGVLAPLILYVIAVGAPISAQRAFGMVSMLTLSGLLGRQANSQRSLMVLAWVLLAISPTALLSPGMQLSFASVMGLLWTHERYAHWLERGSRAWWWRGLRWLGGALLATTGASIATAPLVAYHFGEVSVFGSIANLWVVPVISFVLLPLAMVAALLSAFWWEGALWVGALALPVEDGLIVSLRCLEGLPLLAVGGSKASLISALGMAAVAVGVLRPTRWPWATILGGLGVVMWLLGSAPQGGTLRVIFLSVGQGDATLISLPSGEHILIDAGGESWRDTGKAVVAPALEELGIDRLDLVILTHPDFDHFGGMASVLTRYRPKELWTNGDLESNPATWRLQLAAHFAGTRIREVDARSPPLLRAGLRLKVLWPVEAGPQEERNNGSLVLRLDYKDAAFLFPGDAEEESELALIERGAPLAAQVLKAGHHGSRTATSRAFLERVDPKIVISSVGRQNRFGFPHDEVVRRVGEYGSAHYRTDWAGAIMVETDGKHMDIKTFR